MTLSYYLETNGLKPSQFAKIAGVPATTIIRLLNGQREPGLPLLIKIMKATNGVVTPNDFLEYEQFDQFTDNGEAA